MYRTRRFLKTDNAEIPVSFPPNLEISAALGIYQVLKDIGPGAADKQERGITYGQCGGRRECLTHTAGKGLSGDCKPGGWIGEKNRILSLYEAKANQNRGADSFLHPDPVGELIQFCVVR